MRKNKAFTLVEMLIVTAMLAVISLAVYATLNNGIKIWQKVNQEIPSEGIDIFFEKITSDLRNSLKFSDINFWGIEDAFGFATLVNSRKLGIRTVGGIKYIYHSNSGTLTRGLLDYSDMYSHGSAIEEVLLRNIKSVKLLYYTYDAEKKKYIWLEEWIEEALPLAVRIELELKGNDQTNKFTRTVSIPVS
jgi:prepilin-type N-terminal cleavage/methylation domain-containing protein